MLVDRYLFDQPNGLCFSPDEKRLYVNDTVQTLIRVFDVAADGSLSNGRVFASGIRSSSEPGVPDGMKCDARGNVWVTAPGGIWVYAPSGDLIGKVRVPELVANLSLGRRGFSHPVHDRDPFGLHRADQGRPAQRALYERDRPRRASASPGSAERVGVLAAGPAHRSAALRDDHPGHAERRHHARAAPSQSPARRRTPAPQRVVENVRRVADSGARAPA